MSLTDFDKALIRAEVLEVVKEQGALSALSSASLQYKAETFEAISKQLETITKGQDLLAKQETSLRELEVYKWVIRGILLVVLGGSVWTVLKYKEVIDTQIAARMVKSDRLNLAVFLANSGQWRESLSVLDDVWADLKKSSSSVDPEYRSFFYRNVLWVVSQAEERLPDGTWVGELEWKQLNQEPDFQREFVTTGRWDDDEAINNNFAFCHLKFGKDQDSLAVARRYFEKALQTSSPIQRRAPHLFAIAMVDIIEDQPTDATKRLQEAAEVDPGSYNLSDLKKYRNSFLNSTEFQIWVDVARRLKGEDFQQRYMNFLSTLPGAGRG